ncbi:MULTISPECIES: hypothetical protein [unclassified Brevibacillus]|uniref:hypothetical protein n=1 Tax=unclassified Brevibacillus TaxID=2684853 RepID=UPI00156A94AE|nr:MULTISPECIES: hypothetical protein [unclassified Brevibacillus]MDH6352165.1 hypothetical protein [Brevibacillus sp. 1238]NRQ54504.1 hypothetical protein [Brevibacillus sp. HD1.4A]UED67411.1 hypothetical protein HP435_19205 [Brevibacillus sp. HD3.3A]
MTKSNNRKRKIDFIITETNGALPIEEWLIPGLTEFAKEKYGLSLNVWVKQGGMEDGSN